MDAGSAILYLLTKFLTPLKPQWFPLSSGSDGLEVVVKSKLTLCEQLVGVLNNSCKTAQPCRMLQHLFSVITPEELAGALVAV